MTELPTIPHDEEKCSNYIPVPYGFGCAQCSRNGKIRRSRKNWCWQHAPEETLSTILDDALEDVGQ